MNVTECYIFKMNNSSNAILAWEHGDIDELLEDEHFTMIGTVQYDTELNKIVR